MSKKTYIGVGGVAHKVKKGYIGVDGVARRIKKAYIGIGGVARPCWGEGKIERYGLVTYLSAGRRHAAATSMNGYAVFAGGIGYDTATSATAYYNTVSFYDSKLTVTERAMQKARYAAAAARVGQHVVIGGGVDASDYYATVDAFDSSLSRSVPSNLALARQYLAATNIGNYALFAGGHATTTAYVKNTVDAYDTSLTHTNPTTLYEERSNLAATSIGDYALFGGGFHNTYLKVVDAYNKSLTRSNPTSFTHGRRELMATSIEDYAIFAGGYDATSDDDYLSTLEVYNKSLTHLLPSAISPLSVGRSQGAATSVGGFAIFGGGTPITDVVDVFDKALTRTIPSALYYGRSQLAGASVGDYALFAGGGAYGANLTYVDAYVVS